MDLFRFDPPTLTVDDALAIAAERYGVTGTGIRLRGERSHNTLITSPDGRRFVLKIASPSEPPATIDLHARALVHLERRAPELPVARMVAALGGELVPELVHAGRSHRMRLVTYLAGVTFDDHQTISIQGLRAIGELMGALSAALRDFEHPAAGDFMPWDIANGLIVDDELWDALGADARTVLEPARPHLESALAGMAHLPRQIIHNDGHAGNLLRVDRASDRVTGVIDFGDLVHTITVADLAVSGANLAPSQADPVAALAALTAGFRARRDLTDDEIEALPHLVLCRLALSTLLIEHQIHHAPHISEAVRAERPGLLRNVATWLAVDARRAVARIREAS
ncbi:MAG TPA: phosphotransferase [Ilumatobacter sp.]